jgi:hypothetical protein
MRCTDAWTLHVGYMRSPDLLQTVLHTLDEIRRVNPDAIYGCPRQAWTGSGSPSPPAPQR